MQKLLLRSITLLLVPCLAADPVPAGLLAAGISPPRRAAAPPSVFTEQAFATPVLEALRPLALKFLAPRAWLAALARRAREDAGSLFPRAASGPRLAGFPKHIALIGRPGAGKGAHGPVLTRDLGVPYLTTGDLVRRAVKTEEFPEARRVMESGNLIDDSLMLDMLGRELAKPEYRDGYVLDGFPRNVPQLHLLRQEGIPVKAYLYFSISPETYILRAEQRRREAVAKGEEPRKDDEPAKVRTRLMEYDLKTAPLVEFLRSEPAGRLIELDSESPPDATFEHANASIRHVYERQILPVLQDWVRRQGSPAVPPAQNKNSGKDFKVRSALLAVAGAALFGATSRDPLAWIWFQGLARTDPQAWPPHLATIGAAGLIFYATRALWRQLPAARRRTLTGAVARGLNVTGLASRPALFVQRYFFGNPGNLRIMHGNLKRIRYSS